MPARVEEEPAVGSMAIPLGAAVGGRRAGGGSAGGALAPLGLLAAAGIVDDVSGGPQVFRRLLKHRTTYNVVGEAGDPDAAETLVFVAHHDAAQGGLIYRPELTRLVADTFPAWYAKQTTSPQMLRLVGRPGPRSAALGAAAAQARRWCVSAGSLLAFGDIAHPHGRAGRQRQPDRRRGAARARAAAARASRSRACACCSSPPARRSRSWRACAAGCAATGPRSTASAPASSCSRRSARRS